MTERRILWTVTDPRGIIVSCAEDVWQEHVAYRPELAAHVDAVQLAVQDPDEIYLDPVSTARKTAETTVHWYYKSGLTKGKFAGNFVVVIVKVVLEPDGVRRGYVQSALLPSRVMKRLVLEWTKSES